MMECKKSYFVLLCLVFIISGSSCSEPNSDQYIATSKAACFSSKNLFSCIKYKAARFVRSVISGQIQLIKNPLNDVSETSKALTFLKRSVHMFLATHGIQISFGNDSGARLITDSDSDDLTVENRGKRKRKLRLIVPFLMLLKLVGLKVLLFKVLLGIGGIQLLLVTGGLVLLRYLNSTPTSCSRMQGMALSGMPISMPMSNAMVGGMGGSSMSNMNMVDPESEQSSTNYRYHYTSPSYHSSLSYPKDWANSRAYSAFNNYVDPSQSRSSQ